jgi:diguanylate cyclase (GGDEF)-like protein
MNVASHVPTRFCFVARSAHMLSVFSLVGILIASCLMSVAIMGSLIRSAVPGVSRWCAGYGLLAAAASWILLGGSQPGAIEIVGVLCATLGAVLLLVQGTRQFSGANPTRRDEAAAFIVIFVLLVYFTCIAPNINARGVLVAVALIYGRIMVGALALRHASRGSARYAGRLVAGAAWLGALVYVTRIVAIVLGIAPPLTFLAPSLWNVVFLGLAIVTLPLMSVGMVMLAHDQILQKMEKLATFDELTGALTRRAFTARANVLRAQALENGRPLSIAILDIDRFKSVNDSFGHAVGDRLLAHVSSVVSGHLRAGDLFGRLGGEEFAIVFANAGSSHATALTNALRVAVERSCADAVRCTLSGGVGEFAADDTLESAMARADAALYAAKAAGRNRVVTTSDAVETEVGGVGQSC